MQSWTVKESGTSWKRGNPIVEMMEGGARVEPENRPTVMEVGELDTQAELRL